MNLLLPLLLLTTTSASQLLIGPQSYPPSTPLPIFTDLISSTKTQVPYKYTDLPYCKAGGKGKASLGTKLQGGAAVELGYEIHVGTIGSCKVLCDRTLTSSHAKRFAELVEHEYRHHWTLDTLPVLMRSTLPSSPTTEYVLRGFPVGFIAPPSVTGLAAPVTAIYNHVRITVRYHDDPSQFTGSRIVGFEVVPYSIAHEWSGSDKAQLKTCNGLVPAVNDPSNFCVAAEGKEVVYTYDVDWVSSETTWSDRWDVYLLSAPSDEIHIFAIVNSLMIILFLSGIVIMILLRTLSRDITMYNELATLEEAQEEWGWKLVHADVFRPPKTMPLALSVFVGSGTQIGVSILLSLVAICMKSTTSTTQDKGQTLTLLLLLYVFSGSIAGYFSARCYKLLGGKDWKTNTICTAMFFPGCLVCLFTMLNVGLAVEGAGSAVNFTTILAVFLLWGAVSTPLMFVGSYFGFKKETIAVPLKTTAIARVIPEGVWYTSPLFSILVTGILPFGSVCIELFFIMSSLWLSQIYYVFGFLLIVVLILILTCAEMSIVMTYFQLTNEDYKWWWRSFAGCSSSGLYLFLYSIWYYESKLDLQGFLSGLVYFTYNAIIALAFGLFTGAVGFLSSLLFVRAIYGSIKVD